MTTQLTRGRFKAAALALCGIAAAGAAAAVLAAAVPASAAGQPHTRPAAAASASLPVVVNCTGHDQTRPTSYILTCADANSALDGLHWAAWGSSSAFASGTYTFNDCVPYCAAGHFHNQPVLVALWHVKALPGKSGKSYYSEVTLIFTGSRSYKADGKTYHLPQTQTEPLSPNGGE